MRPAHIDPLVPVDPEPLERLNDLVIAFFAVPCTVGIFNAEHHSAVGMPGFSPVKQRSTHHPYMRDPRRGRAETHTDICRHLRPCFIPISLPTPGVFQNF